MCRSKRRRYNKTHQHHTTTTKGLAGTHHQQKNNLNTGPIENPQTIHQQIQLFDRSIYSRKHPITFSLTPLLSSFKKSSPDAKVPLSSLGDAPRVVNGEAQRNQKGKRSQREVLVSSAG